MRFYILSDLHIGNKVQADDACEILKKLCCEIRKCTVPTEPVLFVILGDIINQGETISFDIAEKCLDLVKQELKDYTVNFEFVPGNHDLDKEASNLELFDKLISKYGSVYSYDKKSVFSKVYENVNFIFADSTLSRDYKALGKLDVEAIQREIKTNMSNILFCHHALTQNLGGSHDVVENSSEVYEKLNKLSISFYFHGHVHRANATIPTKGLVEIGCGSLSADTTWDKSLFHQFSVGCIKDGALTFVERWVDTSDGSGLFAENQIYPKKRTFADPDTVLKEKYEPVNNYISRIVLPYEEAILDPISRLLSNNREMCLRDIIENHDKILLLSDAGMGKSIELQNVAHVLQTKWHTFLFSLKNYTNQNIYDILPSGYKSLSPSRYLILFDGYDEMSNECREEFEKKVRLFSEGNPGVHIVVSSRTNFCRLNENQYNKLPGYRVFMLDKLKTDAISKFLEDKGIEATSFYTMSRQKKVYGMLTNPFYLTGLAEIFLADKDLPSKTELMEKLIEISFNVDNKKFPGNLDEHYLSLFTQLERVAFAMQLTHKTVFNDHEEYQRLFTFEQRELVKKSGLLNQVKNGWTFLHNNFREYLSARFMCKLPEADALSVFSDGNYVKPSWVNTLGYLTGLNVSWDLVKWLNEHSPSVLVKFEADRLPEEKRTEVFKSIFKKYEESSLYFYDEYCNEEELADFANNKDVVKFLIEKINNPVNAFSQYNAVNILRHFHSLFGLNEQVKDCLVSCCRNYPNTNKQVCRLCLLAFNELKLYDSELTVFLMNLFGALEEDYIRLGMYEYLVTSGEHNDYVEYFLGGIKYIEYSISSDDIRVANERIELVDGLKCMSTVDSIISVLRFFVKEKHHHFYDSEKVISVSISTAVKLFREGNDELYSVALKCYEEASKKWSQTMTRALAKFFSETNTIDLAIVFLAEKFKKEPQHISDLVYEDENAIEYLKKAYIEGNISSPEVFVENVIWYVRDADNYNIYAEIIKSKDNIDIPKYKESKNYESLKEKGKKEFLDSLFSVDSRTELLFKLVEAYDKNNIVVRDLLNEHGKVEIYSALWYLQSAIYHYANPDIKVAEFFDKCDIEAFVICIFSDNCEKDSKIILSKEQKQFVENAVKNMISKGIFVNAIKYHENGYTFDIRVPKVLGTILYLEFDVDEDTLLRLIEIPAYHFDRDGNNYKYEFLEAKLGKDKLRMRLLENVKNKLVKDIVLEEYIDYFCLLNDDSLTKTALDVCKDSFSCSSLRTSAWEYLWRVLGTEYIEKEVIPYANGEFLVEIDSKCKDVDRKLMRETMEKQYCVSSDIQLLAHLIALESEMALKQYLKQVKRRNGIPESHSIIYGPTAAIEGISNPELMPILNDLFKLTLKKGFVDSKFRGLKNALIRAFINCKSYDKTIKMLNGLARRNKKNKDNFRYCNHAINEIESSRRHSVDIPMTIDDVISYINKTL